MRIYIEWPPLDDNDPAQVAGEVITITRRNSNGDVVDSATLESPGTSYAGQLIPGDSITAARQTE